MWQLQLEIFRSNRMHIQRYNEHTNAEQDAENMRVNEKGCVMKGPINCNLIPI